MFFVSSILNNAALGYSVSIPVFIIVRSGGIFVTMILSYLLKGKTYTSRQMAAVAVLTIGVGLATYRRSEVLIPLFVFQSWNFC
jgi:solute carrier family 35 (UDP-xylose/UDP-N-acetylglucosamine transporter), member B4